MKLDSFFRVGVSDVNWALRSTCISAVEQIELINFTAKVTLSQCHTAFHAGAVPQLIKALGDLCASATVVTS